MLQRMVIGLLATWLTLSAAAPAAAAPLQIVSGGKLMGATGVDVNGTLYDVQFSTAHVRPCSPVAIR